MQEVWRRIEEGLRRVDPSGVSPCFRPRASEKQLASFERRIGYPLPDDFRESWSIHDGALGRCMPFGEGFDRLLQLAEMAGNSQGRRDSMGDRESEPFTGRFRPRGPIARFNWHRAWVTIVGEGTGNYQCIDLAPPAGGTVGQVFGFDHERGPIEVKFPSLRAYLERFASDLEYQLIGHDQVEGLYRVPGPRGVG